MKLRTVLFIGLLPLLAVLVLLAREISWRRTYPLVQAAAAAPDEAFVAEVRSLPDSPLLAAQSSGVFVRRRWALLRSLQPQLVFAGSCDSVDTRWMSRRRLVIECQLRSGEPRLLQALVEDVVIELVIQPHFAQATPFTGQPPPGSVRFADSSSPLRKRRGRAPSGGRAALRARAPAPSAT